MLRVKKEEDDDDAGARSGREVLEKAAVLDEGVGGGHK